MFLVNPQQAVKGKRIRVTDEWQAMVALFGRITFGRNIEEEPTTKLLSFQVRRYVGVCVKLDSIY